MNIILEAAPLVPADGVSYAVHYHPMSTDIPTAPPKTLDASKPVPQWRTISTAASRDKLVMAIVLFVAFLVLYLYTQAHYYTFDSISYAYSILRFERYGDRMALFHPHHLLFNLTGWILWKIARVFGYIGGPLEVIKTMNAVLAALGVSLLSLTLRTVLTRSRMLTVLFASAVGVSFGYWVCATDGRVNIASTMFLIGAVYALVLTMQSPSKRRAFATGLLAAMTTLYHESNGMFFFVACLGIWLAEYPQGTRVEEKRTRWRLMAVFIASWFGFVVVPYLIVGLGYLHLTSFEGYKDWAARYAVLGWWWDFRILHNLRLDLYAIRKCLFTEPLGKQGTFHIDQGGSSLGFWLYAIVLLYWLFIVYVGTIAMPLLVKTHYRRYIAVVFAWILINTAFFTIWQPDYFVFRIPAIIGSAVLLAIVSSHYRARSSGPVWLASIGVWVILFGMSNYIQSIGPHRDPKSNPFLTMADSVKAHTQPNDLIIMPGTGYGEPDEVYVPYFSNREVFSIHTEMAHHHNNFALLTDTLSDRMNVVRSLGGTVYLFDDLLTSQPALQSLAKVHNVSLPMIRTMLANQQRTKAWIAPNGLVVWKLTPAINTAN